MKDTDLLSFIRNTKNQKQLNACIFEIIRSFSIFVKSTDFYIKLTDLELETVFQQYLLLASKDKENYPLNIEEIHEFFQMCKTKFPQNKEQGQQIIIEHSSVIPSLLGTIEYFKGDLFTEAAIENIEKLFGTTVLSFPPITEKPKDFESDVFVACEKGKLDSVRYHFEVLHAAKEATCTRSKAGKLGSVRNLTALHIAVIYNQLNIVRYLCEVQKVNTEAKDDYDRTPLNHAISNNHLEIVKYLCEDAHADKETQNQFSARPLHIACLYGYLPIVKYLIEVQKVDKWAKTKNNRTPYLEAKFNHNKEVMDYLRSIGASHNEVSTGKPSFPTRL